jgi:hypothetical protein
VSESQTKHIWATGPRTHEYTVFWIPRIHTHYSIETLMCLEDRAMLTRELQKHSLGWPARPRGNWSNFSGLEMPIDLPLDLRHHHFARRPQLYVQPQLVLKLCPVGRLSLSPPLQFTLCLQLSFVRLLPEEL